MLVQSSNQSSQTRLICDINRQKHIDKPQMTFQITDIRESSYKLKQEKAKLRKDHSLETKQKLQCSEQTLHFMKNKIRNQQITFRKNKNSQNECQSKTNIRRHKLSIIDSSAIVPNSNQQSEPINIAQQKNMRNLKLNQASMIKNKQSITQSQNSLQSGSSKSEKEAADDQIGYLRVLWEAILLLQCSNFYPKEISEVKSIIKKLIMRISKPQFTAKLEQKQQNSFKVISVGNSGLCSHQQSKQEKQQTAINCCSSSELELKKISYILDSQNKRCQQQEEKSIDNLLWSYQVPEKLIIDDEHLEHSQIHEEDHINPHTTHENTISLGITSNSISLQSPFSISNGTQSGFTIDEIDKVYTSRKIMDPRWNSNQAHDKEIQWSNLKTKIRDRKEHKNQVSDEKNEVPQKNSQSLEVECQTKRILLNDIITMLNEKYHKNIQIDFQHQNIGRNQKNFSNKISTQF